MDALQKIIISSTYCKHLMELVVLEGLMLEMIFSEVSLLSIQVSKSTTRINICGERGLHSFNPLLLQIYFLGMPLTISMESLDSSSVKIQLLH